MDKTLAIEYRLEKSDEPLEISLENSVIYLGVGDNGGIPAITVEVTIEEAMEIVKDIQFLIDKYEEGNK